MKALGITRRIILNLILFLVMVICLIPFWWVFVMSTMENGKLFSEIPMIPGNQFFVNLQTLLDKIDLLRSFSNSVLVSVTSTFMTLFFSSLAAYAFAKHRFRGKEIFFMCIIITMFMPGQLSFVGYVRELKAMHLLDTLWALIMPNLGSGMAIFIMRGYMSGSISDSLVDAARIDGCRDFRIFLQIVVPLSKPVIASMGILSFMGSWNSYSGPLVVLYSAEKYTLPLTIATVNGTFNTNFAVTCVGIFLVTLPMIIIYLIFSRYFIEAISAGAVKG